MTRVPLKHAFSINEGLVDPTLEPYRDMPLIAPNHIEAGTGRAADRITSAGEQGADSGKYLVTPGDVVYSKIRPALNKVAIADRPMLCSADMYPLTPRPGVVDAGFGRYYLLSSRFVSEVTALSGRVAMPKVNRQTLGSVSVTLLDLHTQRKIADFLDRETTKIDAMIGKQRALVDGLRQRRVRTVLSAVTTGVRHDRDTVPSEIHWSAEVPSDWNVIPLKRVFASVQPGVWGEDPDGGEDDIRCVRVADFDRLRLRVGDSVETIRKVSAGDRRARVLQQGDLLVEKSGGTGINPVGFVAIYDHEEEAICANFIARMRVDSGQDSRFWMYALHASYASGLTWNYVKQTTGIQNLDLNALLSERFPVPPLEEQREIAAHMDRETARIDALISRSERLIELSQERRSALITAAVTGQIDTASNTDTLEGAA